MPSIKEDLISRKDCIWALGILLGAFATYWTYSTTQIKSAETEIKRLNENARQDYMIIQKAQQEIIANNNALIHVTEQLHSQNDSFSAIINRRKH